MIWFKVEEKLEQCYSYSPGPVVLEVRYASFNEREALAARLLGLYPKAIVYDTVPLLGAVSYTERPKKDKILYGSDLTYYRLKPTEHASNIIDYLLSAPFKYNIEARQISRWYIRVKCWANIPNLPTPFESGWYYYMHIILRKDLTRCKITRVINTRDLGRDIGAPIPLNCSILNPLWFNVVKAWEIRLRDIPILRDVDVQYITNKLLSTKFIDRQIIQLFIYDRACTP
ncbi:MAG: hypothetical protein QW052_07225 [Candidatus Nitrosocaldaceae archaeon]